MIDSCLHHRWVTQTDLVSYMSKGWQEFIGRPGSLPRGAGSIRVVPPVGFRNPIGDKRADAYPEDAPAGSDPALLAAQALDPFGVERAVLAYDEVLAAPTVTDYNLAHEVCRAANDWCVDRWLSGADERFYGLVLAPNQIPVKAAEEIRRVGSHERMVGVVLGGNGAATSFGHLNYHPIYEACAELDLPVVLHVGGDGAPDARTSTAPAGNPTSFTEYSVMSTAPLMTHVVSFILHGVFDKFPSLKLLVAGGGALWVPPLFWRLDANWRGLRREVPWVEKHPSEYLREHVRLTTWPLERAGSPAALAQALGAFDGMEEMLCFASGYPDWNWESVDTVRAALPAAWHQRVFEDNASAFFRWPAARPAAGASAGIAT